MRITIATGFVVASLCGLSSLAEAGERMPMKGSYTGIDKSMVMQVGPGHTLISINADGLGYILEGAAAASPMQHAYGQCAGIVEIKDGVASGHGNCTRTTAKGAKWVVSWKVNPDLSKGLTGTFDIVGVDGPSAGWKGSGTFGPRVDTLGAAYITPFQGWLEKP